MKRLLTYCLGGAIILTVIFGSIYATGQQTLRQNANDPQVQLAEDIAARLDAGGIPGSFTSFKVDVNASLSPFVIVYDKQGKELASAASLDGKSPTLPKGVLDHTNPQNRITWEPQGGVRIAAVVNSYKGGYVLAGRNLREVEQRENQIFAISAAGWLVSELALAVLFVYKGRTYKDGVKAKKSKKKK